jgi:hypothetical protein
MSSSGALARRGRLEETLADDLSWLAVMPNVGSIEGDPEEARRKSAPAKGNADRLATKPLLSRRG